MYSNYELEMANFSVHAYAMSSLLYIYMYVAIQLLGSYLLNTLTIVGCSSYPLLFSALHV